MLPRQLSGLTIYLGNGRKYVLRLPDGQEVVGLQQADAGAPSGLRPGGIAALSREPAHATAFPA